MWVCVCVGVGVWVCGCVGVWVCGCGGVGVWGWVCVLAACTPCPSCSTLHRGRWVGWTPYHTGPLSVRTGGPGTDLPAPSQAAS